MDVFPIQQAFADAQQIAKDDNQQEGQTLVPAVPRRPGFVDGDGPYGAKAD